MTETVPFGFECVFPIEEHARLVMEWRNDPATLEMSFNKQPKEWPAFLSEFQSAYFSLSDLPPLFVLEQGQRVAFLRFRSTESPISSSRRACEISLNVAPFARGRGIGTKALLQVKDWIERQGYDDICAEIFPDNQRSQKVFEQAGFKKACESTKSSPSDGHVTSFYTYLSSFTPAWEANQSKVFVIAEAGSNWRVGSPERDWQMAKALIHIAVEAGADAIKFQTYRPDTIYVKNAGVCNSLAEAGIKEDIHAIFSDLSMPYDMIPRLSAYCQQQGIAFMSTAFSPADFVAVDPYVSIHKIASYEIGHLRLLELAGRSKKPLILSTGASVEEEIAWAVDTYRANGGSHLTLLQCTAKYPSDMSSMNLKAIEWMRYRFHAATGLSDHSRHPVYAPAAAVALGAKVIEKHFTLHNSLPGPDHAFALTPTELKEMVTAIRSVEKMLGSGLKKVLDAERELRLFAKRGIQAIADISPGDILKEGVNIDILRPGKQPIGLHARYLIAMEGMPAKRSIPYGAGIQHGDW
jgi:sialic acid synthase SpsE/RimJ/RimL family protein N-acetyltransferase